MRWELAGAAADYTRVFKDANSVTYIRRDGRRVRKTVAYSRGMRSSASGEVIGRQMQAIWAMSRPAAEALRREMAELGERIADVVVALDLILAAWDEHPECRTARAAWEANGHSIDEIDLGEIAA